MSFSSHINLQTCNKCKGVEKSRTFAPLQQMNTLELFVNIPLKGAACHTVLCFSRSRSHTPHWIYAFIPWGLLGKAALPTVIQKETIPEPHNEHGITLHHCTSGVNLEGCASSVPDNNVHFSSHHYSALGTVCSLYPVVQIGKELELYLTYSALPHNTGHPKRAQVIIAEEINLYKIYSHTCIL